MSLDTNLINKQYEKVEAQLMYCAVAEVRSANRIWKIRFSILEQ